MEAMLAVVGITIPRNEILQLDTPPNAEAEAIHSDQKQVKVEAPSCMTFLAATLSPASRPSATEEIVENFRCSPAMAEPCQAA